MREKGERVVVVEDEDEKREQGEGLTKEGRGERTSIQQNR